MAGLGRNSITVLLQTCVVTNNDDSVKSSLPQAIVEDRPYGG